MNLTWHSAALILLVVYQSGEFATFRKFGNYIKEELPKRIRHEFQTSFDPLPDWLKASMQEKVEEIVEKCTNEALKSYQQPVSPSLNPLRVTNANQSSGSPLVPSGRSAVWSSDSLERDSSQACTRTDASVIPISERVPISDSGLQLSQRSSSDSSKRAPSLHQTNSNAFGVHDGTIGTMGATRSIGSRFSHSELNAGGVTGDTLNGCETLGLDDHDLAAFSDLFDPEGGLLNDKDFGAIFSSFGPVANMANMTV
jgi:hypothetical protein